MGDKFVVGQASQFDAKAVNEVAAKLNEVLMTQNPERERELTGDLRQNFAGHMKTLLDALGYCQTALRTIQVNFPYTVTVKVGSQAAGSPREVKFTRDPKQYRDLVLGIANEIVGPEPSGGNGAA